MDKSLSNLITAPWTTMVVFAAVRINLFTLLADKLMTTAEIAKLTGSEHRLLEPLLQACVYMGFLEFEDNRFRNTAFSSKYLIEGKTEYVGDLIKLQYHELEQWKNLVEIIQRDKTVTDIEESTHKTFIKAMNNLGQLGEVEALSAAVDLSGCLRLVDVGGGSGIYSVKLCQKYPDLRVVLLDQKSTLEVTRGFLKDTAVQSQISLREANIERDPYGDDMDVVLLSDVIYDTRITQHILQNAYDCLKTGGQLIVRGYYSNPTGSDTLFSRLFVLQELVFDPEREVLTMPTLMEWVEKFGFQIIQQRQLTELSQILIAKKI